MRILTLLTLAAALMLAQATPVRTGQNRGERADLAQGERIAKLEAVLPILQKQFDEQNRKLDQLQAEVADLNSKINLMMWAAALVSGVLVTAAMKILFDRKIPQTIPQATSIQRPV